MKIAQSQFSVFLEGFHPSRLFGYLQNRKSVKDGFSGRVLVQKDHYDFYNFKYRWLEPLWLKQHRRYFSRAQRGFGETPFHSAWHDVFKTFKPRVVLEIGVYRGQVLSLWQLIAKRHNMKIEAYGISPLNESADSVSEYLSIDYERDIQKNFNNFNLGTPQIVKAFSTDVKAREFIESKVWDLIYIDGSHDFEVVLQDYRLAIANLKKNGVICFDDSSLFMQFEIGGIFKGHPGPSRVVTEFAMKEMKHLMTVGHNNFFKKVN